MTPMHLFQRFIWKPIIALAGVSLVIILVVTLTRGYEDPDAPSPTRGQPVPVDAETYTVEPVDQRDHVWLTGTLTSDHYVTVSARIAAHVNELAANAGDRIETGQRLVRLDDRELQANDKAAEAVRRQAETQFERVSALYEQSLVAEQEFIAAEAAFQTATAQREQARVQLDYAQIVSPLDGIVIDRLANRGDLVQPGQALYLLYDPDQLRLDVQVPERWLVHLAQGDSVALEIGSPPQTLSGEVFRIRADADAETRTRVVQISVPQVEEMLVPGTFGRLRLETETRETLRVPTQAIRRVGQIEQVRVVKDERQHVRLIKTGERAEDYTEVLAGLRAGEQVLIHP